MSKSVVTNILGAALAPISLHQKITKQNCYSRKAVQGTFVQKSVLKMLAKLTPSLKYKVAAQRTLRCVTIKTTDMRTPCT